MLQVTCISVPEIPQCDKPRADGNVQRNAKATAANFQMFSAM
jgi:hypothetical protein